MSKSGDASFDRVTKIVDLVSQAMMLADDGDEFLLGAKLNDSLLCAQARLDSLKRKQ